MGVGWEEGRGGGEWYCFGGPDTEAWSTMPARALPLVFLLFLCTHLVLGTFETRLHYPCFFFLPTLLLARPVNPLCQNSITYTSCLCFTCFFPSLSTNVWLFLAPFLRPCLFLRRCPFMFPFPLAVSFVRFSVSSDTSLIPPRLRTPQSGFLCRGVQKCAMRAVGGSCFPGFCVGWLAFLVDWVWDGGDVEGGVGWARNGGDGDSSGGEGL